MTCKAFFDANSSNKDKCKLLIHVPIHTLAQWEGQMASDLSPGPVLDNEVLYQQIVNPTHLTPDGEGLKPSAFDNCSNQGLSVHRVVHSSVECIKEHGLARAEKFNADNPLKPQRVLWGFACFDASAIRNIFCSTLNRRVFFIFDTATMADASHAEICQVYSNRVEARRFRMMLYDMVKGRLQPVN